MDYERLLKEFLLELKLQNYSKRTIETYQLHHKKFLTFYKKEFGSPIIISNVLKIHYKMFIGELLDLELKTTYINAILKSHKTFWSYLLREQVVEENPLETIKLLKEDRKVLTTFNDGEVRRMLDYWRFDNYISARNKCIIAVLLDTGMRVSELINIKDDNVTEKYIKVLGKGNKWRIVAISNELSYFLTRYKRIRDIYFYNIRNRYGKRRIVDEHLFLGKTGQRLESVATIQLMISKTGKEVGVRDIVRCSPHTFRHYWTIKNLENGQDLFTISKLLGHSKLDTTKIYINSITSEQLVEKAIKTNPLSSIL
ncbi:tyrosine-type recombinase/integrase [Vagococcus fluvialis]|uniref:tyrosine-type recombinase/integrase n=1 Tax=Vagococcus fluvialis TaxID=2738 RepID=UPI002B2EDAB9|nr:tyrosine-type recombinase/integrase [Vagococcus fluvialis]